MTSWSSEYKILRAQNEALKEISLAADTVKVFRITLLGRFRMGFFQNPESQTKRSLKFQYPWVILPVYPVTG